MNTKSNVILIGVILLLVGILSLLQNYISLNYWSFALLAGGGVFLLLYRDKKKSWSLILGLYLLYMGIASVSGGVLPDYVRRPMIMAMFFIVPGLIFLVQYIHTHRKGMLYPASLLIWTGIYTVLNSFPFMRVLFPSLFIICLGFAFLFVYFISEYFMSKWHLYLGVGLVAVGLLRSLRLPDFPWSGAAFMMLAGVGVIIYAVRKR